jgi:hypothetical protein
MASHLMSWNVSHPVQQLHGGVHICVVVACMQEGWQQQGPTYATAIVHAPSMLTQQAWTAG